MIDLRHLRHALALAEHRNFARAAEALLNRAWGRPPEDLTFRVAADSGELKIRWLSDDEAQS